MKILVAEDDFASRVLVQAILRDCGQVHIAVNGREAVEAALQAHAEGEPYELICLDIMMPEMDGQAALEQLRAMEATLVAAASNPATIVMTTALSERGTVSKAIAAHCDGYLIKPLKKGEVLSVLGRLGLAV